MDEEARALLTDPVLAARTSALFAGALSTPDLEIRMPRMKSTSFRLSADQEARADALVPARKANPDVAAFGEVTRSTVLRLALHRGLLSLEAEYLGKTDGRA